MGLKVPTEQPKAIKKKTVMFTEDTVDKNQIDADDLFSHAMRDRSDYDSRKTYGDTDSMMTERTGTIFKKNELSEEAKKIAIMGPAA